MAVIGVDLGGTKINSGLYISDENFISEKTYLSGATGDQVAIQVKNQIQILVERAREAGETVTAVGISVPGIAYPGTGTVWAPNIPGWENYPLLEYLENQFQNVRFYITSDRACYILGETWKGNTRGCRNAIYLAVGTGIAAGILVNGEAMNGSQGIAGAIGWMALNRPYREEYRICGNNEYYASGEGIRRYALEVLAREKSYNGIFKTGTEITSYNIINAYDNGDELAKKVIENAIGYWGMSVANLVSVFNPEKIIFGGGVFSGKACNLLDAIYTEALKWGQPVSMKQVMLECSGLGDKAGLYGAVFFALKEQGKKEPR